MTRSRFESSVTAISWIPSEAITGLSKIPFELGVTHYDEPPPDQLDDLDELRRTDRFREANVLRAFIEVEAGRIVGHGHLGQGHIGATTVRMGPAAPALGHQVSRRLLVSRSVPPSLHVAHCQRIEQATRSTAGNPALALATSSRLRTT